MLCLLQPNIQLIETLIALSIVVVALNNLYPVIDTGRWLLIVFFGVFHGMGGRAEFGLDVGDLKADT